MSGNCPYCNGTGWGWKPMYRNGVKTGEFAAPCKNCNPEAYAVWSEAGRKGRELYEENKAKQGKRE